MNFSDYRKSKKAKDNLSDDAKQMVKNFAKGYEGKNADEITKEIFATAKKSRLEGKLSDSDIDNFRNMFAPMLNREQQRRLDELVKELKNL